jgi:hypothetical protein
MDTEETKTEQLPLVPKTIRVQAEDNELWKKVKDTMTQVNSRPINDTEVFSEVMNRYFLPINQNKETAKQLADRDSKIAALQQELDDTKAKLEDAQKTANANAEAANQQQLAYEARLSDLQQQSDAKNLKEGQHIIDFRPGYYEVVERVAELEGPRRNQQWTAADVINFFIYSRFVKGTLNGNLRALSDSEVRKMEQQLGVSFDVRKANNPEKKEVDL